MKPYQLKDESDFPPLNGWFLRKTYSHGADMGAGGGVAAMRLTNADHRSIFARAVSLRDVYKSFIWLLQWICFLYIPTASLPVLLLLLELLAPTTPSCGCKQAPNSHPSLPNQFFCCRWQKDSLVLVCCRKCIWQNSPNASQIFFNASIFSFVVDF